MKWEILVFLIVMTTGLCAEENGENNEETTVENIREMREYDREVCIL